MTFQKSNGQAARFKHCAFRTALIAGLGYPMVVVAQEVKYELRPRTDANVQADIRDALNFQKQFRQSDVVEGVTGLAPQNRLSTHATTSSSSVVSSEPDPCNAIVIGTVIEPSIICQPQPSPSNTVGSDTAPSPHSTKPTKRMAPITISRIENWKPERRLIGEEEARLASVSRQWKAVRTNLEINDTEASVRPLLSGPITVGNSSPNDSSVVPANYQAPLNGMTAPFLSPTGQSGLPNNAPVMPYNPSAVQNQPVLPGSFPANGSAPPGNYINPNALSVPSSNGPYGQGNMPTYPLRSSTIINGAPFVTPAPCQFDAYYMLEQTQCMQSPSPAACGSAVGPTYSGILGNIVPPTLMPNQVPQLYSPNNSGFRPLLGFGQDSFNVQLGRGIIGQPVAYVPGQPFRNFLRYIFP